MLTESQVIFQLSGASQRSSAAAFSSSSSPQTTEEARFKNGEEMHLYSAAEFSENQQFQRQELCSDQSPGADVVPLVPPGVRRVVLELGLSRSLFRIQFVVLFMFITITVMAPHQMEPVAYYKSLIH